MNPKKKLAGSILKVSPGKIRFAEGASEEIGKAVTRADLRGLIAVGKIILKKGNYHSRVRARQRAGQKKKGRQKGKGSRKGSAQARLGRKEKWVLRIRTLRRLLKELRDQEMLSPQDYHLLYARCKGGFFRNRRHLKLYLKEHGLIRGKSS